MRDEKFLFFNMYFKCFLFKSRAVEETKLVDQRSIQNTGKRLRGHLFLCCWNSCLEINVLVILTNLAKSASDHGLQALLVISNMW